MKLNQMKNTKSKYMKICGKCHQPITNGSTIEFPFENMTEIVHGGFEMPYCSSIGCPVGDSIIENLKIAIDQGFKPEFCRTHELRHK